MCKYFSRMLKINSNNAIYLEEFFIVIVASVSESDTLYGHVTRNAKSREHTYACIVSPYVCVFVLEKLREHRVHWCHVVPGWLSPRRIASRCYVKNGNEPQTSSSFPSSSSSSFLISPSFSSLLFSSFFSSFLLFILIFFILSFSSSIPYFSSLSFFFFILHSPLYRLYRRFPHYFTILFLTSSSHRIFFSSSSDDLFSSSTLSSSFPLSSSSSASSQRFRTDGHRLNEHFDGRHAFSSAIVRHWGAERMLRYEYES